MQGARVRSGGGSSYGFSSVSISNAFIIERISPHATAPRSRRTHLQFHIELAKQLIGGFCGCKCKVTRRKSTPIDNALSLPNLPGHWEVKFSGCKRACMQCSSHGRKTPSGRTPETIFGCDRCGVSLCRSGCFLQYHTENAHINYVSSSSTTYILSVPQPCLHKRTYLLAYKCFM